MSLPRFPKVAADAFILAGGQSSRMGQDKSLLTIRGEPLIHYAVGILRSAGLEPRVAGAISDLSRFAPVIPDDPHNAGLGPLSGICSALSISGQRYSVFLPVDLPLIPFSLVEYLLNHAFITESTVTTVAVAGFNQTFPVVLDRAAAPHLFAALRAGRPKCLSTFQTAATELSTSFIPIPLEMLVQTGQVWHPAAFPPHAWFLNLNTPQDVERLAASVPALFN